MELNSIFHVFAVGGGRSAGLLLLCITNFAPASFAFCKESVVRSSPLHGRRAPSALAQGCFPVHQVLEQAAGDGAPLAFISGTQSEMADAVVFNTLSQSAQDASRECLLRTSSPALKYKQGAGYGQKY
eukprot:1145149-Pelagomonas_calceolata.AAC.7